MKRRLALFCLLIVCVLCAFGVTACRTNHEYVDTVTAPTCVSNGYTTHTCDCGYTYVDSYVDKLQHKYTNYVQTSDLEESAECDYGCGEIDVRELDAIAFNTLEKIDTIENVTMVHTSVDNDVVVFDFNKEVLVGGNATYTVCHDFECNEEVASKTVMLNVGDNIFYILENGKDVKVYMVRIRRLPVYQVAFDSNGGSKIEIQYVQEGDFATSETPERAGYIFDGWGYDFEEPVMGNMYLTASWEAIFQVNAGVITDVTSAGKSLTDIVIPSEIDGETITELAPYSMEYCLNLKSVVIPETVTIINNWAFDRCFALETVVIPDIVTIVGTGAFSNCKSLKSVVLPSTLESISFYMFRGCESLTEIIIPSTVNSMGYDVFKDCTSLETITFNGTVEQWNKVYKGLGWKSGSAIVTIVCIDGEIEI